MSDQELNEEITAQAREEICDFDGHEWAPAGGGLLICLRCEEEQWSDETEAMLP